MPCFHLIDAWQPIDGGKVSFKEVANARFVQLPCGQCSGCRVERSRDWAVRCVHEAACHDANSFVTLTYSDEHLGSFSLVYRDYQNFMRRLRRAKPGVRFYMCGEYGENFERPHWHALLFGAFFEDREPIRKLESGFQLYRSGELEGLWPFGFSSIGDVTFESAAYVARYVCKKITGPQAEAHYEMVDRGSGEVSQRRPEFNRMSLKPGIGARWFSRFGSEVYPEDIVVINGVKCAPPKYYDKLLGKNDPAALEELQYQRFLRSSSESYAGENSPARLAVREAVHKARLSFKRRSLK